MNYNEINLAKVSDFQDGEMKAFTVGDHKIVISRIAGKFYAVGEMCPHYGAPLEEGILSGSRIVCPWHHATYSAQTGKLEEPPALDNLPVYELRIQDNDILVVIPDEVPGSRIPPMVKHDPADQRLLAIIGAGAAGNAAAQTLREDGFKGRVVMITYEAHQPYDRPQLTKEFLEGQSDKDALPLRTEEFYPDYDIELILGQRVKELKVLEKTITFESGVALKYDRVLIASGAEPRTLTVPGGELKNVFTLRNRDDSSAIIRACENALRVAVVGSSFIGIETAYSLSQRGLKITVIGPDSVPFERAFGQEIGNMFRRLHEENGVIFKLNNKVSKLIGTKKVEAVVLENGECIATDIVVVGIGVKPATSFISGIDLLPDGSVKVDDFFRAAQDVYAAGDIATFPYWYSGEFVRIEHWRTAEQQGRIAAHNMAGKKQAYRSVPFFWTTQVGLYFRYIGYVQDWDEIIMFGDIDSKKFIAYFVKNNRVHAAAGNEYEKEMAAIEELMRRDKMPSPEMLKKDL